MKLWLLTPRTDLANQDNPWRSQYDKTFGHVVRAESEQDARRFAAIAAGDEGPAPWTTDRFSTCTELTADGEAGIVLVDFRAG